MISMDLFCFYKYQKLTNSFLILIQSRVLNVFSRNYLKISSLYFHKEVIPMMNTVKKALRWLVGPIPKEDVCWVINDTAELGVLIDGRSYFLYKGESLIYETGKHDNGTPIMQRKVEKREFGECCRPPHLNGTPPEQLYTEGEGWFPLS